MSEHVVLYEGSTQGYHECWVAYYNYPNPGELTFFFHCLGPDDYGVARKTFTNLRPSTKCLLRKSPKCSRSLEAKRERTSSH